MKPKTIFFVDDKSTDGTFKKLLSLKRQAEISGVSVEVLQTEKNLFRAGSCNTALKLVCTDYVIMMDAGTTLHPVAVAEALRVLESRPDVGLVCSRAGVQDGSGLLYRLQKLEYGNTDLSRMLSADNILISHGLFSASRMSVLRQVGFYSEGVLLEDYDLTVKVKLAGFKAVFEPKIKAYTDAVTSWKSLSKQRFRWFLGGLDVLSKFKWTQPTRGDIFGHAFYLTFFMCVMCTILFGAVGVFQFSFSYVMVLPISLAVVNYVSSLLGLSFVEGLDAKDVLLRASVFPELFYCIFLEFIKWKAYFAKCFFSKRVW